MESETDWAEQFERDRGRLRATALRLLGSAADAEDAVQEAWLRASRADRSAIVNPTAWLTTIVGRVCIEILRTRRRRREEVDAGALELSTVDAADPEGEALAAESVSLATLVVLDVLGPNERVAFVLHDMLGVPFEEIAPIVDRSPVAAKKLASRARQRVLGQSATIAPDELARQRAVVEAFLAAARAGDVDALVAVLAPDAVRRSDRAALRGDAPEELHGARAIAEETRGNRDRARYAAAAMVNGAVGVVVAPRGRLTVALALGIEGERIASIDVVAAPARLQELRLGLIEPVARIDRP